MEWAVVIVRASKAEATRIGTLTPGLLTRMRGAPECPFSSDFCELSGLHFGLFWIFPFRKFSIAWSERAMVRRWVSPVAFQ